PFIRMMHLRGEAVGRQPLDPRIGIKKGAVDLIRLGGKHAVQANGVWHGGSLLSYDGFPNLDNLRRFYNDQKANNPSQIWFRQSIQSKPISPPQCRFLEFA